MSRTGGGAHRAAILAGSRLNSPSLWRTAQGELRWKGMVIAASEGTEVKAVADGRVISPTGCRAMAVVVVEHGKGDMSLYGYNQSALVSVGTQVRAGQPIALVGAAAVRAVRRSISKFAAQGQAVNPQPWLGR